MQAVLAHIATQHNLNLLHATPLAGGDINKVFQLQCIEGNFVVKLNNATQFPGMFEAEKKGLHLLASSQSFEVPEVIVTDTINDTSYLLMEYINSGSKKNTFWEDFGIQLALLHQTTQDHFGLSHHNYIGSLPQYNHPKATASQFYIQQRLEPQFKMAAHQGFVFKGLEEVYKNIAQEIPLEAPSLLHGDLWSGNYMVSASGTPVLIDPAVSFAPREMDLAMMHLFGGFPEAVFSTYSQQFPLQENWRQRLPLWQLYYLLVHLTLFGKSYYSQVASILDTYR